MKISPTRLLTPAAIMVQWLAVAACVFWHFTAPSVFNAAKVDAGRGLSGLAAALSQPFFLVPIAILATALLLGMEFRARSERTRFVAVLISLCLCLMHAVFVLGARFIILIPL